MQILFSRKITGCESSKIRSLINDMMNEIKSWNTLSEEVEYEFQLILNELIANSIMHGNQGLCTKTISTTIEVEAIDMLCISIQDEGAGFNPGDIIRGSYPCDVSLFSERGRGLKLIKAICNQVEFNAIGNQIKIHKSLGQKSYI